METMEKKRTNNYRRYLSNRGNPSFDKPVGGKLIDKRGSN